MVCQLIFQAADLSTNYLKQHESQLLFKTKVVLVRLVIQFILVSCNIYHILAVNTVPYLFLFYVFLWDQFFFRAKFECSRVSFFFFYIKNTRIWCLQKVLRFSYERSECYNILFIIAKKIGLKQLFDSFMIILQFFKLIFVFI